MSSDMRRFVGYRPGVPESHTENMKNGPDEAQYEGVVFTSGTCVIKWRTAVGSTSVFDSFEDAMKIHGHPEYGTVIKWFDNPIIMDGIVHGLANWDS